MDSTRDIPFPLINKQAARSIQGRHTEVLVTSFADKILILISQYGKVGSLIHTSVDQHQQSLASSLSASSDLTATSSSFLLGAGSSVSKKTQLYQVYASHISQMIHHQNPAETRLVVLSLALSIQEEPDIGQTHASAAHEQEQEQRRQDRDLFENAIEMVNECSMIAWGRALDGSFLKRCLKAATILVERRKFYNHFVASK
ncbi:hypothetical protein BGZ65_010223, partial [Modicella reniformis]